jgi:hypothetical protein
MNNKIDPNLHPEQLNPEQQFDDDPDPNIGQIMDKQYGLRSDAYTIYDRDSQEITVTCMPSWKNSPNSTFLGNRYYAIWFCWGGCCAQELQQKLHSPSVRVVLMIVWQ